MLHVMDGRVARLLRARVVSSRMVEGGYSGADRRLVTLEDGRTVFVKTGVTPWTVRAVRHEHVIYGALAAGHLPEMLAFEDGEEPMLVLEDLSAGAWPPPWTSSRIDTVLGVIESVSATPPPEGLYRLAVLREMLMRGWSTVARDPTTFLSLRLCSPAWLERALPDLVAAEESVDLDGDALVHFDVRSDNICFAGERTVLVDWSSACIAHPKTDMLLWLPSLHAEGGPVPETLLPDPPRGGVAVLAGFWAANAGLPPPPGTSQRLRDLQLENLRTALPWAARTLGLPEPA